MSDRSDAPEAAEQVRWMEVDRLFEEALDLPASERDDFLVARCGSDTRLLRRVRDLLSVASDPHPRFDGPGSALLRAAFEVDQVPHGAGQFHPGDLVGRYRIVDELGRGGMAVVYDAERADGAFEQRVALKVLRRGLDTEEIVRRFLGERQILSGLEHPNIARLIDGGATADGRPYLVMERVEGEPITDWADRRGLSLRKRVELFTQVADAVQYAHQRLVIHRDLKPSNILVDENGTTKLLDFGIAKLLDPTDQAVFESLTRTGIRPRTPAYASPEQIRGERITTSSDIHQLGTVLYELLTGRRPFEATGLELEAAIIDGRVRRPSDVADHGPRSVLRGDLDAIVMTALHVAPERRYASAADLASDIRRYLNDEPVQARPDTLAYRARRYARRRPEVVVAISAFALLLTGYGVTLVRTADRLEAERDRARVESVRAQQVSDFLVDLFRASDPNTSLGEDLSAFDLLDRGEERADRLAGQPELQAQMLGVIGEMYMSLGRLDRAEPILRRTLDRLQTAESVPPVELAVGLGQLGDVLQRMGRYDEADSLLVASVDLARQSGDADVEANYLNAYGYSLLAQGSYRRAEGVLREALEIRRDLFGDDESTAHSLQGLGIALEEQERFDPAEASYVAALDMMEAIDPEHTRVASTLSSLGRLYMTQGRFERADSVLRMSLALNQRRLGPRHLSLGLPLNELGVVAARQGNYETAEEFFRESLAIQEESLGPRHPEVAVGLNNISFTLIEQGRLEEALPLRRRALEIARTAIGEGHDNTGWFAYNLGHLLERLGDADGAERHYREGLAILRRSLPEGHFRTTTPMVALGDLLARTGREIEGAALLREALEHRISDGAALAAVADVESMLGAAMGRMGHHAEAQELLERGLGKLEEALGPEADLTRAARERSEAFRNR